LNTGSGFKASETWYFGITSLRYDSRKIQVHDMNGDGLPDITVAADKKLNIAFNICKLNKITSITTSTNTKINITYTPASEHSGAIRSTTSSTYVSNTTFRYLTTKITKSDNNGNEFIKTYTYYNGKIYVGTQPYETRDLYFQYIFERNLDPSNNQIIKQKRTYYSQSLSTRGRPTQIQEYNGGSQTKYTQFQYSTLSPYSITDTTRKTTVIQTRSITSNTSDPGKGTLYTEKVENLQFDEFGNVTEKKTTKTPGSGGTPKVTYETKTYVNHKGNESTITPWIIGKVNSIEKCIDAPGCSESDRDKVISYRVIDFENNDTLRVAKKKDWFVKTNGAASWAETLYEYNDNGSVKSVTTPKKIKKQYTYDGDYNSNITKIEIIPLGDTDKTLTRTFVYDAKYGKLIQSIDEYGIRTETELDEFGREISGSVYKDSTLVKQKTCEYFIGTSNDSYVQTNTRYGNTLDKVSIERKYYDNFGRNFKTITSAVQGTSTDSIYSAKYIEFDSQGRAYKESESYYSSLDNSAPGAAVKWTLKEFDSQNRVSRMTLPGATARVIEYAYNNDLSSEYVASKTTTIKNGLNDVSDITHQVFYNIDGKAVKIIKDKGRINATVEYTYDELGRLITTKAGGTYTDIEYYIGTSLQKSISTANAGFTHYTYFDTPGDVRFGSIMTETRTHPNNDSQIVTTTNEYNDAFGRLTKQISPDKTIDFHYDDYAGYSGTAGTNGLNRMTYSTLTESGNTLITKYDYDAFGNNLKVTRNLNGSVFNPEGSGSAPFNLQSSQQYDNLGRLTKAIYPNNSEVDYNYFGGTSLVKEIKEGSTVYASYSDINKRGQIGQINYGNNVKTTYSYQNDGLFNEMKVETNFASAANKTYLHNTYDFYNNGQIKKINDQKEYKNASGTIDLSATYTYDGLNRLSSIVQNGITSSYEFDNNSASVVGRGNLTKKAHRLLEYYPGSTRVKKVTDTTSALVTNYTWSKAGNMLTKAKGSESSTYTYNSDNMLKKVLRSDGETTYYYDASGQRFLKIFDDLGGKKVKTYYFGKYEYRLKETDGTMTEGNATNYIAGADGKVLASKTEKDYSIVASSSLFQSETDFIVYAGLFGSTSIDTSINTSVAGFFSMDYQSRSMLLLMLIVLPFLIYVYFRNVLGFYVRLNENYCKENNKSVITIKIGKTCLIIGLAKKNNVNATEIVKGKGVLGHISVLTLFMIISVFSCGQMPTAGNNSNGSLSSRSVTGNTIDGIPAGTYYYHSNHLGSSTLITDENGNEVTRINYTAYGEIQQNYSGVYNQTTKYIDDAPDNVTKKFTGQEYDHESKIYYYNARYYDPEAGSFTTADTLVPDSSDPMAFNRFMYVAGNPIMFNDPTGHSWLVGLIAWAVTSLLVTIGQNLQDYFEDGKLDEFHIWFGYGRSFTIGDGPGGGTGNTTSNTGSGSGTSSNGVPGSTPNDDAYELVYWADNPDLDPFTNDDFEDKWGSPLENRDSDKNITSYYGYRSGQAGHKGTEFHTGLDYGVQEGTSILASRSGKILFFKNFNWQRVNGNLVLYGFGYAARIKHIDGTYSWYGHMKEDAWRRNKEWYSNHGNNVYRGWKIGAVGSSGRSTWDHLHFMITSSPRYRDHINPLIQLMNLQVIFPGCPKY